MKKPDLPTVKFFVDTGSCRSILVQSLLQDGYDLEGIDSSLAQYLRDGTLTAGLHCPEDNEDWFVVTEWSPNTAQRLGLQNKMKTDQVWELDLEDSTIVAYHIWCSTTGIISAWDWEMVYHPTGFKEDIALYNPEDVVSHLVRRHSTDTYRPSARRIS